MKGSDKTRGAVSVLEGALYRRGDDDFKELETGKINDGIHDVAVTVNEARPLVEEDGSDFPLERSVSLTFISTNLPLLS